MITTYPSTSPELHRKLSDWSVLRLVNLYMNYQLYRDRDPAAVPAEKERNPVLDIAELRSWHRQDSTSDPIARHRALGGLCAMMCPHDPIPHGDYSYGGRHYELDVPALLLTGDLPLPQYLKHCQVSAKEGSYQDLLSINSLKETLAVMPERPRQRPANAQKIHSR